eukprot:5919192-Pleurochrysis_carterae.AAC.3
MPAVGPFVAVQVCGRGRHRVCVPLCACVYACAWSYARAYPYQRVASARHGACECACVRAPPCACARSLRTLHTPSVLARRACSRAKARNSAAPRARPAACVRDKAQRAEAVSSIWALLKLPKRIKGSVARGENERTAGRERNLSSWLGEQQKRRFEAVQNGRQACSQRLDEFPNGIFVLQAQAVAERHTAMHDHEESYKNTLRGPERFNA